MTTTTLGTLVYRFVIDHWARRKGFGQRRFGAIATGGWLGHVSLETTNRYGEIMVRMKEAAMKLCEPPTAGLPARKPAWRDDAALLTWLASL